MRQLRQLFHLSPGQLWLLIQASFYLNAIRLGLATLPFQVVYGWLKPAKQTLRPGSAISIDHITWVVNVASRYTVGRAQCLACALTTQLLLLRAGYPCKIHIGVINPAGGGFEAHAWVESGGEIVMGHLPNLQQFTPLM